MTKRICLSGADMYELEEVFRGRRGIVSVRTGYINAAPQTAHEDALTGAGDELQGIKKGIMELADAIVINKADGDNLIKAKVARGQYERMIEFIRPATPGWETHAYLASAIEKTGLAELWEIIRIFREKTTKSGVWKKRRDGQLLDWMNSMIDEHLHNLFFEDAVVRGRMPEVKDAVLSGGISPTQAVAELLGVFDVHRAAGRQVDLFTN